MIFYRSDVSSDFKLSNESKCEFYKHPWRGNNVLKSLFHDFAGSWYIRPEKLVRSIDSQEILPLHL